MVSPYKVVEQFDDSFHVLTVVFLQDEEQFCLHGGLVVVLLLILHHFDGHLLAGLVVEALDDGPEGALTNLLNNLESICNLVASFKSVVAFLIIEAVVNESLQLGGNVLLVLPGEVPYFFILVNFGSLVVIKHVLRKDTHHIFAFARELRALRVQLGASPVLTQVVRDSASQVAQITASIFIFAYGATIAGTFR